MQIVQPSHSLAHRLGYASSLPGSNYYTYQGLTTGKFRHCDNIVKVIPPDVRPFHTLGRSVGQHLT
jgi:hypothetical protein